MSPEDPTPGVSHDMAFGKPLDGGTPFAIDVPVCHWTENLRITAAHGPAAVSCAPTTNLADIIPAAR